MFLGHLRFNRVRTFCRPGRSSWRMLFNKRRQRGYNWGIWLSCGGSWFILPPSPANPSLRNMSPPHRLFFFLTQFIFMAFHFRFYSWRRINRIARTIADTINKRDISLEKKWFRLVKNTMAHTNNASYGRSVQQKRTAQFTAVSKELSNLGRKNAPDLPTVYNLFRYKRQRTIELHDSKVWLIMWNYLSILTSHFVPGRTIFGCCCPNMLQNLAILVSFFVIKVLLLLLIISLYNSLFPLLKEDSTELTVSLFFLSYHCYLTIFYLSCYKQMIKKRQ